MAFKTLLTILSIILLAAPAKAAEDNVTASISKDAVAIGEKFTYSITVKNGKDIEFPAVEIDNLTLVKSQLVSRGFIFNKELAKQYVLRGFTTGQYVIGGYKVKYRTAAGLKEIDVPEVRVEIRSSLFDNDTLEIAGIKGPAEDRGRRAVLIVIAVALLIAAVAVAVYYLIKKRKAIKERPSPPLRAHEIAYEALRLLKEKNLDKLGLVKEYFSELSSIVRYYIEDRFGLKAPEMTTEEFLLMVRDSKDLSEAQKGLLKDFLNRSDMVKFARYGPSFEEIRGSFISAGKFVDETRELP